MLSLILINWWLKLTFWSLRDNLKCCFNLNDYFNVKNFLSSFMVFDIEVSQFNSGHGSTILVDKPTRILLNFKSGLPPALKNKLLSLFLVWVFLVSTFPLFSIILPGWFFIFRDIISNLRLMLMLYYKLCHAICVIIPGSLLGMFRTDNPFWDCPVPPRTDWDYLVPQHTYT